MFIHIYIDLTKYKLAWRPVGLGKHVLTKNKRVFYKTKTEIVSINDFLKQCEVKGAFLTIWWEFIEINSTFLAELKYD